MDYIFANESINQKLGYKKKTYVQADFPKRQEKGYFLLSELPDDFLQHLVKQGVLQKTETKPKKETPK